MSSLALFPCNFTGEPNLVSKLPLQANLKTYTDEDLIKETAATFKLDESKLAKLLFGKISVFNTFTLEKERAMCMFRSTLATKLLNENNCFFYGLHTCLFPQDISELLKVLVVAHKQERINRGVGFGYTEKEAKKMVKSHDVQAFSITDFLFKKEAYDESLFDLVVPVQDRNEDEVVQEIIKFFHNVSVLRTKQSQLAARNMLLAAQAGLNLLNNGHNLQVSVEDTTATITISNAAFNLKKYKKELENLVMQNEVINSVEFKEVKTYEASVYRQQKFELPSKVLLVDDERDFVQAVSQRLITRDVGTYGVFNGEDALKLIDEDCPDVMVLDLKMPGLHGTEVLKQVKENAPDIEVIILTGHGNIQDEHKCMELGAFAYMNKPVDIEVLSETIIQANKQAFEKRQAA